MKTQRGDGPKEKDEKTWRSGEETLELWYWDDLFVELSITEDGEFGWKRLYIYRIPQRFGWNRSNLNLIRWWHVRTSRLTIGRTVWRVCLWSCHLTVIHMNSSNPMMFGHMAKIYWLESNHPNVLGIELFYQNDSPIMISQLPKQQNSRRSLVFQKS